MATDPLVFFPLLLFALVIKTDAVFAVLLFTYSAKGHKFSLLDFWDIFIQCSDGESDIMSLI